MAALPASARRARQEADPRFNSRCSGRAQVSMVQVTHLRDGTFYGRIFFRKVRRDLADAFPPRVPLSPSLNSRPPFLTLSGRFLRAVPPCDQRIRPA